ncbi:MAG: 2-hydroxyacid dehydrogenase [Planctomycetes bacterium]|nr:2-hydroxyacid dehydrogenase [Planctomycetota bacterium]
MNVAIFSARPYLHEFFEKANLWRHHELTYLESRLCEETAPVAAGFRAVCIFVNDIADRRVLTMLRGGGTELLALRCAGYNNVDILAAADLGLPVVRVPGYSPHAVAEHTVGLMLALNRKIHRAYQRVREGNFSLTGLMGYDMAGRTVGVIGTGRIGAIVARILHGFGCRLLLYDPRPDDALEAIGDYTSLEELFSESDIITLHCPLTPETHYLIDSEAIRRMKPNTMLINTSRGALVDTRAVTAALKSGRIGYLGLDVYEEEAGLFYADLSDEMIHDDVFARLLTFPNVIITSHQSFFTEEAMTQIAETTLASISAFEEGVPLAYEVTPAMVAP